MEIACIQLITCLNNVRTKRREYLRIVDENVPKKKNQKINLFF